MYMTILNNEIRDAAQSPRKPKSQTPTVDPYGHFSVYREFGCWRVYVYAVDGHELVCSFPPDTRPSIYMIVDAAKRGDFQYV